MNGYGIDAMVQSRADSYRSNPDGLAKSYANNQQLIDLLALQKLKSEKEAAARQLALTAQQAPGTVAQQREQELLGMTRNEIAQQTGAVGEQQEQRMLQQAGLAGLPAQNLESMQGYAEGGVIGAEEAEPDITSLETVLQMLGSGISVPQRVLESLLGGFKQAGQYGPTLGEIAAAVKAGYKGEAPEMSLPGMLERRDETQGLPELPAPEATAAATMPRTNTQDMQGVGGLASLIPRAAAPAVSAPVAPVAAATAPRERTALEQALEQAQLAALQTSGADARERGQQTAEDFFSPQTEARNARYAEIQRKLQEIDAREADPKARAKEAMREWMRGAANTSGGLSRLLQGGSRQSEAYIDEQEAADKARMMEMFGLEKDLGAEELAMARDIFGAGENAENRNSATLNTAMQTVTQTLEGALNREEEAKFNAERNQLLLRQVDVDEARNALEQGRLSNAEFQTKVTALGRQFDMMLSGLEAQLKNTLPGTPDELRINTAIEELSGQYARTMQELTIGVMPSMGGSGASVSPEIQALLDKYSQ